MTDERVEALRRAVAADPDNATLRLLLAEQLETAGRPADALAEYEELLGRRALPPESAVRVGLLSAEHERLELARGCLEVAREAGIIEVGELQQRVDALLRVRVRADVVPDRDLDSAPVEREQTVTFADVGGLDDVKKAIHRMVILPTVRPELYERYGRKAGGGVLLYGPPGCGKTLLARATAGECGLPFFNVRIESIVDPYFGVSEQQLHDAFERARLETPAVLFVDELDAIAFARHKEAGSSARRLTNVMLQEMDAIGSDNEGLLVLAATNMPWDVDEALLRPGRFDRQIFVPPPDEVARRRIVDLLLATAHADGVDAKAVARRTPFFSGADLRALIERAVDLVIDEALDSGGDPPLRVAHIDRVLPYVRPSTSDWLARARNYVEFANVGGRYDDIARFLRSKDVRRLINPS